MLSTSKKTIETAKRVLYKRLIAPFKYRSADGYDAPKYWSDRFEKYGTAMRGPGHEGLTEEENNILYEEATHVFDEALDKTGVNTTTSRVLEIGPGNGFWTEHIGKRGTRSYSAVDITDVLFPELSKRFPDHDFSKKDVTVDRLEGEYDLIYMIDVAQHIVSPDKFRFAMENVKRVLAPGGWFLIGAVLKEPKDHLFYVRFWSIDEVDAFFEGYGKLAPLSLPTRVKPSVEESLNQGFLVGFQAPSS
jgi:SAM-dependent methyltransferase